jgi:hypothetical protein
MSDLQIVNAATGDTSIAAKVNQYNQLFCRSVGYSLIHEATLLGNAYAWNSVAADLVAEDTALAVGNESKTMNLVMHGCYIRCDLATQVDFHFPAYPTWAGTAVTGVNLNRASTKVADATAYTDETGNTQGAIFLTGYHYISTIAQTTTCPAEFYDFKDAVILGEHDICAVDVIEETAATFECTFIGFFIDK